MFYKPEDERNFNFYPEIEEVKNKKAIIYKIIKRRIISFFNKIDTTIFGDYEFDEKNLDEILKNFEKNIFYNNDSFFLKKSLLFYTAFLKDFENTFLDAKQYFNSYLELFKYLDTREEKNNIYLGRDSIYIYFAHRAFNLGRGVVNKRISYLNFPAEFKNDKKFNKESLKKYIYKATKTNENDLKNKNLLFVDIGYRGSANKYLLQKLYGNDEKKTKSILLVGGKWAYGESIYRTWNLDNNYNIEGLQKPIKKAQDIEFLNNDDVLLNLEPENAVKILESELIKYYTLRYFYLYGEQLKG